MKTTVLLWKNINNLKIPYYKNQNSNSMFKSTNKNYKINILWIKIKHKFLKIIQHYYHKILWIIAKLYKLKLKPKLKKRNFKKLNYINKHKI
jgi:hypothetical protein